VKRRPLLLWAAAALAPARAQGEVEANTASRADLESLPGLGPALAQRLLGARPFANWTDLMRRVPGIKAATARKLSAAGLRVDGRAFESAAGGEAG
jgi:competence protein ComEA